MIKIQVEDKNYTMWFNYSEDKKNNYNELY